MHIDGNVPLLHAVNRPHPTNQHHNWECAGVALQVAGAMAASQTRAALLPVPLFTVFDATTEAEDGAQPPDGPRAELQHFPKVPAHPRAAPFC